MGYDIIKEMAELVLEGLPHDELLSRAGELLGNALPFEQSCIYTLDEARRVFKLSSCCGSGPKPVEYYGASDGALGLVMDKKTSVEIEKPSSEGAGWEGGTDEGLIGFKSAYLSPLLDGTNLYGVIYLKSRPGAALSATEMEALEVVALQITSAIRFADLTQHYRAAYDELTEIQARLANTEKLLALGDMAANLAHEIKNPLLSIGGFAARVKSHLDPDSPGLPYVDQMLGEIRRVEKVMDGVVRFLKDNAVELERDDANSIVDEALAVLDDELQEHSIEVVKNLDPGTLPIMVDREQLKIVFENLIANAIQSMGDGGTLTVSTSKSDDSVIADFVDSGGGIDDEDIGDIFNPFFTTKKHGTGLGLPIANSIILLHQGSIQVKNNPGAGACFTVRLPSAPRKG